MKIARALAVYRGKMNFRIFKQFLNEVTCLTLSCKHGDGLLKLKQRKLKKIQGIILFYHLRTGRKQNHAFSLLEDYRT